MLIANKIESNGLMGNIMISENTKNLLDRDKIFRFSYKKYKDVEFKLAEKPIPGYLINQT